MRGYSNLLGFVSLFLLVARSDAGQSFPLDTTQGLAAHGANIEVVTHQGRTGLRVAEEEQAAADTLVVLEGTDFGDGVIEVELSGQPRSDARPGMRGFVGIAFRLEEGDPFRYECLYLRPANGRAQEQLRRNHSTQYVSHPEHPWHRMRRESPGVYESYVDLVPGEWTKVRIVVAGESARLYVDDADQPCLVVNDLKRGRTSGAVALWIGEGTEAHFRNLTITP
jgi:hypothetical protein